MTTWLILLRSVLLNTCVTLLGILRLSASVNVRESALFPKCLLFIMLGMFFMLVYVIVTVFYYNLPGVRETYHLIHLLLIL